MDDTTLLLLALLRHDKQTYDRLVGDLRRRGEGTVDLGIFGFAFYVAVRQYFGQRRTKAGVIRFVSNARIALVDGRDMPVAEAEALTYAALDMDMPGVVDTVRRMDIDVATDIEGQLLVKLIADMNLSDEQLNALLLEAEQLGRSRQAVQS
jgi:hypothetical protein